MRILIKFLSILTILAACMFSTCNGGTTPSPGPVVAVTGISLNKNSTSIMIGGTETLIETITPSNASNKNVSWETSNSSIATVTNGVVTGVSVGVTTITVKSIDGNKTDTCSVTVSPVSVPVSSIALNNSSIITNIGGNVTLTAIITPTGATNQNVTWSSSNNSIATVTGGVVTGVAEGTAIITVTSLADSSKTANCTVSVRLFWTKLLGFSSQPTQGNGIAVDLSGNSYVTGLAQGNLDGQTLSGICDVFVTKYDRNGSKKWTKLLGVYGAITIGKGITVDTSGNSYITGTTNGYLDGQTLTGTKGVFVIKYDTDGNKKWTKLLGVTGSYAEGCGIAVDSSGNSYVTGYTNGNLDGQTLSTSGNADMFVIKYDTDGVKKWTKLLGVNSTNNRYTYGNGIAADSSGNCYVTGYTTGSGTFDGQSIVGSADVFVIKYDTDGAKLWTNLLGVSNKMTKGHGIAVDLSGNSYVTGSTNGNLDGQILSGSNGGVFVIKYNSSGIKQWTKLSGNYATGFGITVDSSGNSYVAGSTYNNLDGQILTGYPDVFVIKYNTDGIKKWTKLLGVAGSNTEGYGIAVDISGACFVTGYTSGNLDGESLTGTSDVFITIKLSQ